MYPTPTEGYTIYSKSQCPACDKTKALLPSAKIVNCDAYLVEEVDGFLDFIWSLPTAGNWAGTFPMIFKDGKYIGGYSEISNQFNKDVSF
jgi:glutaredoxin